MTTTETAAEISAKKSLRRAGKIVTWSLVVGLLGILIAGAWGAVSILVAAGVALLIFTYATRKLLKARLRLDDCQQDALREAAGR